MPGRRSIEPPWRTIAVGGAAFGAASVVALGAAPAGAVERTAVAECLTSGTQEAGRLTLSGFPANTTVNMFILLDGRALPTIVFNGPGAFLTTNSSGSVTTTGAFGPPDRPVGVGVAVYLDRDGNARWDPDRDDTLYRGDGVVTQCPETLTLTPK
jgi:hypothetical protein